MRSSTEGNHFVRVKIRQRFLAEEIAHGLLDLRHPCRSADHNHALDVVGTQTCIAQGLLDGLHGFRDQRLGDLGEGCNVELDIDHFSRGQTDGNLRFRIIGQVFLGFAATHHQKTAVLWRQGLQLGLLDHPAENAMVEIVATESGVATSRHHFENTLGQLQDRDIESATAQVIDSINAFRRIIEAIGNGGRSRFVEQAQNIEAGQTSGILGGLTLRVVKIGWNGNHCPHQITTQGSFGTHFQAFKDFCRNFDRAFDAGNCFDLDHARSFNKIVGH